MLLLISFMPFEKTQTNKIKSVGYSENRSFLVPRKVRFLAMTMFEQARHYSFGLSKTFELYACARGNNGQNEKKLPLSKEERLSNKEERLSNKKGRPARKEGTTAQPSGSGTQG